MGYKIAMADRNPNRGILAQQIFRFGHNVPARDNQDTSPARDNQDTSPARDNQDTNNDVVNSLCSEPCSGLLIPLCFVVVVVVAVVVVDVILHHCQYVNAVKSWI